MPKTKFKHLCPEGSSLACEGPLSEVPGADLVVRFIRGTVSGACSLPPKEKTAPHGGPCSLNLGSRSRSRSEKGAWPLAFFKDSVLEVVLADRKMCPLCS